MFQWALSSGSKFWVTSSKWPEDRAPLMFLGSCGFLSRFDYCACISHKDKRIKNIQSVQSNIGFWWDSSVETIDSIIHMPFLVHHGAQIHVNASTHIMTNWNRLSYRRKWCCPYTEASPIRSKKTYSLLTTTQKAVLGAAMRLCSWPRSALKRTFKSNLGWLTSSCDCLRLCLVT